MNDQVTQRDHPWDFEGTLCSYDIIHAGTLPRQMLSPEQAQNETTPSSLHIQAHWQRTPKG